MPWHKGPPVFDPVLGRYVSEGEWCSHGYAAGVTEAGTVPPPGPASFPAAEPYTQTDGKWRCGGCGLEKDSEKAIKLHLPYCKGKKEG